MRVVVHNAIMFYAYGLSQEGNTLFDLALKENREAQATNYAEFLRKMDERMKGASTITAG